MLSSIGSIPLEASKRFGNKTALILADRSISYNELEASDKSLSPMRWTALA